MFGNGKEHKNNNGVTGVIMSTAQLERALALALELRDKLFAGDSNVGDFELDGYSSYVSVGKLWTKGAIPIPHTFTFRLTYLGHEGSNLNHEGSSLENLYEVSLSWGDDVHVSREFIAGDSLDRLSNVLLGRLSKEGYVHIK